jgi:hypothetical protein
MYSALLRVNSDLILVDKECSSTGSQIDVYASKDGVLESFLYEKQHATKVAWPQSFLRRKVYRCNLSNSEEDVVLVNESFGTSVCVVIVMDLLDSCTILFLHLQHGWRPVEELVQSLRENSLARWLSFSTMIWHLKLLECCGGPQISCHSL